MAEINLDELIPEDLVFKYQGEAYAIPGDLDVDVAMRLFKMLQDQAKAEQTGDSKETERNLKQSRAFLLELFRERSPELDRLPFGINSTPVVIIEILKFLGVLAGSDEKWPVDPTANRATKRASAKAKPRPARSSTGSRR